MFGLRLGKLGAAIKAGTGSVGVVPLFSRDYEAAGSLGANATFARSSSATIIDHEGVIRTVPSGAARFNGLRLVRNRICDPQLVLIPPNSSEDLTGCYASNATVSTASGETTLTATAASGAFVRSIQTNNKWISSSNINIGDTLVFSVNAKGSGSSIGKTFSIYMDSVSHKQTAQIILTSEFQRMSVTKTLTHKEDQYGSFDLNDTNGTIGSGESVIVDDLQLELVTGQTNQNPSEYVSVGVLSAPYHGANVDGIKYFATENGNSVVSNVVTEDTGAAITGGYLLMEPAATNLHPQFSDIAAWGVTAGAPSITSNTHIAPDGTLSADTITDPESGAFSGKHVDLTIAAGTTYVFSVYVKKTQSAASFPGLGILFFPSVTVTYVAINTDTGALTVRTGAAAPANSLVVEGGDYWRVFIAFGSGTETSMRVAYYAAVNTDASGAWITSAQGSSVVWGAQLETGTIATSPIPTSGSAVTRAAETLSYSGAWTADNETRAITDAGTVDTDDWDGIVDATINGADNLAQITSITVYTTGERPA